MYYEEKDECHQLIIPIIGPQFERDSKNIPWHKHQLFIDSTASLERFNQPTFIFPISTHFESLPIAVCIVSNETIDKLATSFTFLKDYWIDIEFAMTDDAQYLKTTYQKFGKILSNSSAVVISHRHIVL